MDVIEGYKTCFIDTCYISNVLKRKKELGKKFIERIYFRKYLPCYSLFTIGELMECDYLFNEFIDILFIAPGYILNPHNLLLQEEIKFHFEGKNKVESILLPLPPLKDNHFSIKLKFVLNLIKRNICLNSNTENELIEKWKNSEVANSKDRFNINFALELSIATQLKGNINPSLMTEENINKIIINNKNSFLSVRMMELMIHYYFNYSNRKVKESDIVDIVTSANLPYVDAVITEKFKSEAIRQIQRKFNYLKRLEIINQTGKDE